MKKIGFIAAAMTMLLSVASVYAAEDGINLSYDASDARNSATTRCVDVVIGGEEITAGLVGAEIYFDVESSAYESFTFVPADGIEASQIKTNCAYFIETSDGYPLVLTNGLVGYLQFTVAEDAAEFTVALNEDDTYAETKKDEILVGASGSVTIPAWSTGGGEVVDPEPEEVETTGTLFNKYADPAVYTFVAGEKSIADVADKTLTWKLTSTDNGTAEVPVTVTTDLNGEGSVIFGLMIVNDNAENFDKLSSAVLVIE